MALYHPLSQLTRRHLIFPLSLVLFEFATYIAHDMIQPGMLLVTQEFAVGPEWVSTSLTAYLIGGLMLQWLLGPLSDRVGRRPVLLSGVAFFMLTCVATHWVQSIEQFVLLRFLQGISLCFIGSVGYAAVQEAFNESLSVKIMALMANVALLAPLAGPLAGAAFLSVGDWRTMFWLFGGLSAIALVGLWQAMPETAGDKGTPLSLKSIGKGYFALLQDRQVMSGSLAIGLVTIPCLSWVALSPVILIHDSGLSRMGYALLQLPVFMAMIAGNFTLSRLASRVSIAQPLRLGAWPVVSGLAMAAVATTLNEHSYLWLTAGLSIYGFGTGLVSAGLYRMTLFSSSAGKGSVAAMVGMVTILVFALGIEAAKASYFSVGSRGFSLVNLTCGLLWLGLVLAFLRENQRRQSVVRP
ncbi:DHA1 family multidrug/chloramphenicol efflux transport protein-like MFS transporter [Erwinia persicina]|jgi:DHA1 family multidrug/chloramphenicol efflux transport protein-like MFS transporter|uniref:Multidrug transporter MdfA n=1 Tax=Erwinia plantamica TaxID=3237104 RepID=A0ABW7CI06_9GAMM|nr:MULTISPECIES: MFS transporter [Erwinia]MCP1436886.1 DHA1 family multidrug/chloramphenicol efflux transport protein-like MFS transporter [Erwinia persicina]MDN4625848.1 MFS transporter [Erwinia sp. PsM31]MDN8540254.1 MFS transporter [Erwinia sp. BC051422]